MMIFHFATILNTNNVKDLGFNLLLFIFIIFPTPCATVHNAGLSVNKTINNHN